MTNFKLSPNVLVNRKVFMVKINFTTISIKSNTKFKNEIISSKGKNRRKRQNSYYDNLTKKLTKTSLKI